MYTWWRATEQDHCLVSKSVIDTAGKRPTLLFFNKRKCCSLPDEHSGQHHFGSDDNSFELSEPKDLPLGYLWASQIGFMCFGKN